MTTKAHAASALLVAACLISGCTRPANTVRLVSDSVDSQASLAGPVAASGPNTYADIVDRVAPAVVTIRSERRVRAPQQFPFADEPFLREFFGRRPGPESAPGGPGGIQRGIGSGVVVRPDGYCLTNHHVIDGAEEIRIEFSDGRILKAKLIGSDPPSDLAVLKVDASSLPVLSLGNSDRVRVGDIVLAVGNPLGVGQTVTMGIISAKGRTTGLSDGSFEDFLQTDAAINRGNSGGALVSANGELIGINSQIVSPSGGNVGIGFSIPSNMARSVLDQLLATGKVRRSQLGIGIQPLTSEIASSMGLKDARGILVNSVTPGSPAEAAGIRRGDVISAFNGSPVENGNAFRNRVASSAPGTEVTLTVWRDGREQQLRSKLGEFKVPEKRGESPQSSRPAEQNDGQLGVSVQPLTASIASRLRLPAGTTGLVVGEVNPTGPAAEAGIANGDVILEVNRQAVNSAADVKAALQRQGSPALLLINRAGQSLYLTVTLRK